MPPVRLLFKKLWKASSLSGKNHSYPTSDESSDGNIKFQKCKVMAAWDGDKIEKFDGRLLCFICTFREKRKSTRTTSDKNKENKNGEKTSKEGPKKDSKGREDEKPDDKPTQR